MNPIEFVLPGEIEKRSFEIISEELEKRQIVLPKEQEPVTKRVIHTSADFDYAETMCYSDHAVEIAKELILKGADIVTDTNMAKAGVSKPSATLVLGGGHSIGIPLAVSAKKSLIVPTASMTVHPVRMTGLVVGAPQTYQYFNQIQEQIVNFVTKNSHISREDFLRYMMATDEIATDVGTVLYGEEAVSSGLMDAIGSLSDALSLLHRQIERRRKREKSHNQ